jgi:hypothetical protein
VQRPADIGQPRVAGQPPADRVDAAVADGPDGVENGSLHRVPAGQADRGELTGAVHADPAGLDEGDQRGVHHPVLTAGQVGDLVEVENSRRHDRLPLRLV